MSGQTAAAMKGMSKWGNQTQWMGRQLQYNWSLPILAAGGAATKWALDSERAFTRVAKVYGDASLSAETMKAELKALEGAFVALSNHYGVAIEETTNIAAEWAAAGASGLALAKNVELTMKTMVLGELEAAEATEALIAIQAQYGFTADELTKALARLNAVENQTGTTTADLIQGFSRAAGVARAAGIDVQHLAAMIAALTPAAGSAAQAGNAIKTIVSRLLAPTGEAADILNEVGIELDSMAWKSANGATRIEMLSKTYEGLSDAQKGVASATLASRYQINKFEVLMEAVAKEGSYYWKALEAAADANKALDIAATELNKVLDSNPQKVKQVGVVLQNSMVKVIQPLLPMIVGLAQQAGKLGTAFGELPPELRKLIVVALVFLALIGPLTRYLGSLVALIGVFGRGLLVLLAPIGFVVGGLATLTAAIATFTVTTAIHAIGLLVAAFAFAGAAAWRMAAQIVAAMFSLRGVAAMSAFWSGLVAVTAAGAGAVVTATGAAMAGVARVIAAARPVIIAAWAAMQLGILSITLAWRIYVMAAWGLLMQSLVAMTAAFGAAVMLIWRAIPLTMAAGLKGPFAIILALWSALSVGILGILHTMWVHAEWLTIAGGYMMKAATKMWQGGITALTAAWAVVQTAILARLGPTMATIWRATGVSLLVITATWQHSMTAGYALWRAGWTTITVAWGALMASIWAAISMSWAAGLRSPYALMLAMTAGLMSGMGAFMAAGWKGIQDLIVAAAYVLAAIWRTLQITLVTITVAGNAALAAVYARLGPTLRSIWIAISVSLAVISATMGHHLAAIFRLTYAALAGITVAFGTLMAGIWRVMGLSWAAGLRSPYALILAMTSGLMTGIGAFVAAGWVAIQNIIVAGAHAVALVWRTLMVTMIGLSTVLTTVLPIMMRGLMTALVAIFSLGGKALLAVFTRSLTLMVTVVTRIVPMIVSFMSMIGPALIAVITSPWGIAAAAVIVLIIAFWDELKAIWQTIVKNFQGASQGIVAAFDNLPNGIRNAFMKVVAFIRAAAMQVQEWLSYLNPFARHSPSLVDNVRAGMAEVRKQYGTITQIAGPIGEAYAGIKRLNDASASLRAGAKSMKLAKQIEELREAAPRVVPAFIALSNTLGVLESKAETLDAVIQGQEQTVAVWKQALDDANSALDIQKDKLSELQKVADGYKDTIAELESNISDLASTPITGMGAMEDAIWGNEMAQKRLRLEIMRMEEAGQTYEDLESRIASLNGEIESLRGTQNDLRAAGAGSEVLKMYDDQIAAIEAAKGALRGNKQPMQEATNQLAELQRQSEILSLEQAVAFDPLTRQIEKASSTMQEMPFDQIIAGINENRTAIGPLQTAYDQATLAVKNQEAAVAAAQVVHDQIQAGYDVEQQKLDVLKNSYDQVSSAIQDVTASINDMQAATELARESSEGAISPALENFRAGAGGDFADVGGTSEGMGREGGSASQAAGIEDFTKDLEDQMGAAFEGIDMWGPFKDMWAAIVKWWKANVDPWISGIKDFFKNIFTGLDIFGPIKASVGSWDWGSIFKDAWDTISGVIRTVWNIGQIIWELLGPDILDFVGIIVQGFRDVWEAIQTVFRQAAPLVEPFLQALGNLWAILQPIVYFIVGRFLIGLQLVWSVLNGALGPVIEWVIGLFLNIWQVIQGVIQVFSGLFTLDFGMVLEGLWNLFKGLWGIIWDSIVSIGDIILGALGGLASGLWDAMIWVANQLFGGLGDGINAGISKVWDWIVGIGQTIWDAITDFLGISSPSKMFADIGGWIMEGLGNGISSMIGFVIDIFTGFFNIVSGIFSVLGTIIGWLWSNVVSPIFTAIGAIVTWLWSNVISPIIGFIIAYIQTWAAIIGWLWTNVVSPIFAFIGAIFQWIWSAIIMPIIDFIILYIQTWAAIFTWIWESVISPIFGFIGAIFTWIWESIIMPIIDLIVWYIGVWAGIISWLWDNVIKPIFGFIGDIFSWIWDSVIKPIIGWIMGAWDALGKAFDWVWQNLLKPLFDTIGEIFTWLWEDIIGFYIGLIKTAWDGLGTAFNWVYDHVLKPMFDAFGTAVTGLKSIFETVVGAIGTAWDGLRNVARIPINFVIETVLNNGLIKAFNAVVGFFGLDSWKIDNLTPVPAFAKGGPVNGRYSTDRADDVPAWLTAKEYVQPVAAVRKYGIDFMEAVRSGRFPAELARAYAGGGTVDQLERIVTARFPRANKNSGRRNTSDYHGRGMAIDLGERGFTGGAGRPYLAAMNEWIADSFSNSTELIYTGLGDNRPDLKNGRPLNYGGATNAAHRNHVHWAMTPEALLGAQAAGDGADRGGTSFWDMLTDPIGTIEKAFTDLLSGVGDGKLADYAKEIPGEVFEGVKDWITDFIDFDTGGILQHGDTGRNRSGHPERVLSPAQTAAFDRLVTSLDRNGVPSVEAMEGAIFRATQRAHAAEAIGGQTVVNNTGDTNITYNFYGDLEFPNITSGDDAEVFLSNLGDLAGGHR